MPQRDRTTSDPHAIRDHTRTRARARRTVALGAAVFVAVLSLGAATSAQAETTFLPRADISVDPHQLVNVAATLTIGLDIGDMHDLNGVLLPGDTDQSPDYRIILYNGQVKVGQCAALQNNCAFSIVRSQPTTTTYTAYVANAHKAPVNGAPPAVYASRSDVTQVDWSSLTINTDMSWGFVNQQATLTARAAVAMPGSQIAIWEQAARGMPTKLTCSAAESTALSCVTHVSHTTWGTSVSYGYFATQSSPMMVTLKSQPVTVSWNTTP